MAGAAILGQSRKLVSALRAQPRTETGRNAGNRKAAWGPVPTGYLQEWPHSSLVGLRTWALLESISSQREEWNAEERDLVPGVLQPSAKVSYEAQHRSNERSGHRSMRILLSGATPLQFAGFAGNEVETMVMCVASKLGELYAGGSGVKTKSKLGEREPSVAFDPVITKSLRGGEHLLQLAARIG